MKLKELFTEATKWTQGYYAKTSEMENTQSLSPTAVCWCLKLKKKVIYV